MPTSLGMTIALRSCLVGSGTISPNALHCSVTSSLRAVITRSEAFGAVRGHSAVPSIRHAISRALCTQRTPVHEVAVHRDHVLHPV